MHPALGMSLQARSALIGLAAATCTFLWGIPSTLHASDPVIAAAGDIACALAGKASPQELGRVHACHEMETSDLLLRIDGLAAVLTLGDNQYPSGALKDFQGAYDRS